MKCVILWTEKEQDRICRFLLILWAKLRKHLQAGRGVRQERPCTGKGWEGGFPSCSGDSFQPAGKDKRRRRAGGGEGRGEGRRKEEGRREEKERGGGGEREEEKRSPQPESWGYSRSMPSSLGSGFKIAVVSFVQHEKEPQQSAAGEVGGGGKGKKGEVEKEITSASQPPDTLLKGTPGGSPGLALPSPNEEWAGGTWAKFQFLAFLSLSLSGAS